MATTNSTETHKLNSYLQEKLDNSGMHKYLYVCTGNEKTTVDKRVLNDTFTLDGTKTEADVSAKLLNYNDILYKNGADVDSDLSDHQWVSIIGHPDKFIYDYEQDYNNCGVDSCLNILSMAGLKDIVEVTPSYEEFLKTPQYKTYNKSVWNGSTWVIEEVKEEYYPEPPKVETEDQFLLWAIQNSDNDNEKYLLDYNFKTYSPDDERFKEYNDTYVIHSKNHTEYKKIEDLQKNPTEIGGTYDWMRTNILAANGLESSVEEYELKVRINDKEPNNVKGEPVSVYEEGVNNDGEPCTIKKTKKTTIEYNNSYTKEVITESEEWIEVRKNEQGDWEEYGEQLYSIKKVTTNYTLKREQYGPFPDEVKKLLLEGKGIIIHGSAGQFVGQSGGAHAIVLNGIVETDTNPALKKTVEVYIDGKLDNNHPESEYVTAPDILGFYVLDTGNWLGNIEGSQYVSIDLLYNFLTDAKEIDYRFDTTTLISMNVTKDNIRAWADDLNLVGNDRKNVLQGNNAKNSIDGGKGNDSVAGANGDDKLYGGADADTLNGGMGSDTMEGGSGNDLYLISAIDGEQDDVISLAGGGADSIQFDSYIVDPSLKFIDEYNNEYMGSYEFDIDSFTYQNKNGNLLIEYEINRTATDIENPTTKGSLTVLDYFKKSLYHSIKEVVFGEIDQYGGAKIASTVNLVNDVLSADFFKYSVEQNVANKITGTKFRDQIIGGNKNDSIKGAGERDYLDGGAGQDTIKAGDGDDTIIGSYGNDKIYGEAGENRIIYAQDKAFCGFDTIYSGKGTDIIDLSYLSKDNIAYIRHGNNLVLTYDTDFGCSVTIADYFKKKGRTSVASILTSEGYFDIGVDYANISSSAIKSQKINYSKSVGSQDISGGYGYDTITGSKYDDRINGDLGNDVIYGGSGNDTIIGGLGSDKMYGQGGDNTFVILGMYNGLDTIYSSGTGKTIIDFSETGFSFDNYGVLGAYDDGYSCTKSGNDLIFNYAGSIDLYDNSSIRLSNFFKSKNTFILKDKDGNEFDLRESSVYFKGQEDIKNKITGSSINDYILGQNLEDNLKGGNGNDTIIAGLGADTITAGKGYNVIKHAKGDGNDVIYLTKGESVDIILEGVEETQNEVDFAIVKKDLIISYKDDDDVINTLTLKNFGTKDVTNNATKKNPNDTFVSLYLDGKYYDLREDKYFEAYTDFSYKKYKYSGNWHSEVIDASSLNKDLDIKKNRGASINAGAGHDEIIGSIYNDTIKGGNGNDMITSDCGTNKVDGNNGSDIYNLFVNKVDSYIPEVTTITDTGKTAGDVDTAIIHSSIDELDIWFNIDRNGKTTYKFNVKDDCGYKATISGVEKIELSTGDKFFDYNSDTLKNEVIGFLNNAGYKDVSQAMSKGGMGQQEELLAIFSNNGWSDIV